MSSNGSRVDRLEKTRHSVMSRRAGSCYGCVVSCLSLTFPGVVGDPDYHLQRRGHTRAKIIIEDDAIRWAEDFDHPDARYAERASEHILASINALEGRFTADEIQRTFDVIMAEWKAGTLPEVK